MVSPLARLREKAGERVSPQRESPRGENPHPALRADLSRKREGLRKPAAPVAPKLLPSDRIRPQQRVHCDGAAGARDAGADFLVALFLMVAEEDVAMID